MTWTRMVSWMPPWSVWWRKASWMSGVEEEEATEGAAGLCRPCPWPSGEAGEDGVVEITAAKKEAVDESTIGTVRAMGRVHNR